MLRQEIFKNDDGYFEHLESDIWLMDNHKWALYIWEQYRKENKKYMLVHVDHHWDAIYDFEEQPEEEELLRASAEEIKQLISNNNFIQYDSFIAPAIARGLINNIHFLCFQDDTDQGLWQPFLDRFKCKQTIHSTSKTLPAIAEGAPFIFDFCIDVFNRSGYMYKSELWDECEINDLLIDCKTLVQHAELVTISMSYGCSGTEEDTRKLTELVVSHFMEWRNNIL